MQAVYAGDETAVHIFGHTFVPGVPVSVSDPHAIAKLSNHPQFAVQADAVPTAKDEKKPKK